MGWKSVFQLGSKIAEKKLHSKNTEETSLPRQDTCLPLNGRIGGLLELQKSPFIVAASFGSFISIPTENIITAISRVKVSEANATIHRYYVNTGDEGHGEQYVQVFSQNNDILEIMYCEHLTRFIPQTHEEQILYTGEADDGLGVQTYILEKALLEELGIDELTLNRCFTDSEALEYYREINPQTEYVKPIHATEIRIDDAGGKHGLEQEVYFMPYARLLGDGKTSEYLIISLEVVASRDGNPSKREIHVDFMIGIMLDQIHIQIF